MSPKIEDLVPSMQFKARGLLAILTEKGIPHVFFEGLRTSIRQQAYFAQGRESLGAVNALRVMAGLRPLREDENKGTITNCDGIDKLSPHQSGRAMDIVALEDGRPSWDYRKHAETYKAIAAASRSVGLHPGADWPPIDPVTGLGWDPVHHEL